MKNEMFLRHRKMKGLSQQEVADITGVCKDYIYMIENNRRRPGLMLAKQLADLFETTVDVLFF